MPRKKADVHAVNTGGVHPVNTFRYIGDPLKRFHGVGSLTIRGIEFRMNVPTVVEDAELAARLDKNRHFERA
jgi:hypothetical protein